MSNSPNLFNKIVHSTSPFLATRSLAEIGKENYGAKAKRPLVLFSDEQEALEKSIWFYAHNILPLIGEPNNIPFTIFAAKRYKINALVSEPSIAEDFLSRLEGEYEINRVAALTLIASRFDVSQLLRFRLAGRGIRAILGTSAVGAFAEACPEAFAKDQLVFHADGNSVFTVRNGRLFVGKFNFSFPLIDYDTRMDAREVKNCV